MESKKGTKIIFNSLVLRRQPSAEMCAEVSGGDAQVQDSGIFFSCAGAWPQAMVRAQPALLDLMDGAEKEELLRFFPKMSVRVSVLGRTRMANHGWSWDIQRTDMSVWVAAPTSTIHCWLLLEARVSTSAISTGNILL